jgi:alkanesulfonate monooxygenase SsuD/methylene tetrahydromethanopterin reductase-like flavin-dependent oxidoreductase (luciferase family)
MLRVAVKLPAATGRIGDYLADVIALEAAGADSIWIDAGTEASTEPWILLGAIAAVTHRVRLGMSVDSAAGWPAAVDTLGRLSGGRVVVGMRPGGEPKALLQQLNSRGLPWSFRAQTQPAPKHFATSRQPSLRASRCRASASCR